MNETGTHYTEWSKIKKDILSKQKDKDQYNILMHIYGI